MSTRFFPIKDEEPEEEEENKDLIGIYDKKKGYRGEFPDGDMYYPPLFSYTHVDIGKTAYHFHLQEFDGTDRCAYFEKLKKYSQENLHDLVHNVNHRDRFVLAHDISNPEFELAAQVLETEIKEENKPILGHFRLYHVEPTKQDILDIQAGKDVRNPRIFFLLCKQSTCYIMFYDPFHKIHPMGKSTIESLLKQFE